MELKTIKREKNGCYVKTIEDKLGCSYDAINNRRENRINAITAIAAISRGKDNSKNPEKRFNSLCSEAAPDLDYDTIKLLSENNGRLERGVAGRPLEFCPVVMDVIKHKDGVFFSKSGVKIFLSNDITKYKSIDIINSIIPYSYLTKDKLYTNLRVLYNYLDDYALEIFNTPDDFRDNPYFIVEVKAPYFVFAQIRTHCALSQVAVSERVTEEDEVWLPHDFMERLHSGPIGNYLRLGLPSDVNRDVILKRMKEVNISTVKDIFKSLGYKKEIYNRWYNHMKYKRFIIGGYLNNPRQWGHFLLEREAFPNVYKSWVQPETQQIAIMIRDVIEEYLNTKGGK